MPSPLDEVLLALQGLLDAREEEPAPARAGEGNFRCENCVDCSHCRFCNDCVACDDCTYCDGCRGCVGCTHCKYCERCEQITHSSWSAECAESSYLTLCLDCESCVQCFACVGLSGEEFCVLNEKLPRKAYFSRVAALRAALEERVQSGWTPPWHEEEEEDEVEVEAEAEAPAGPEPAPLLPSESSARPVLNPERSAAGQPRPPAEDTVDTGLPVGHAPTPRRGPPPWTFADVRRETPPPDVPATRARDASDSVPTPPPYGSSPDVLRDGLDEPRERPRDRYGWSAQAEGTPIHLDWPPFEERSRQEREREREAERTPERSRDPEPEVGHTARRERERQTEGEQVRRGRKRETRDDLPAVFERFELVWPTR